MKFTQLLFIFLLLLNTIFAQNITISGLITSEKKPVELIEIGLKNTKIYTMSDSLGFFELKNIPEGEYIITINGLGFEKLEQKITLKNNENKQINFNLKSLSTENILEEVVISGTLKEVSKLESPVPIEVYTNAFFRANPTPSLFESLQNINGVRPQLNCNVCNTGDIHINGLEGPYTMVLIDGMPIVSGLSTVYGLTGIPQSFIERIEIVKGAASTLYGSEAVGGLINVITKKPKNTPLVSADIFSSNWLDVNTDVGFKFDVNSKTSTLLGINYFNYQNKIDNNRDGFTDVTLQNRISVFNKWNFERKQKRQFNVAVRYVNEDRFGGDMRWNKSFRGSNIIYGESIYTKRWELFGLYQLPTTENINLQWSMNGHNQNSFYGTTSYNAQQYIAFGQLTWHKTLFNQHDFLLGAAYRYTYYDDNTPATADENGIKNIPSVIKLPGFFLQDDIKINAQHRILLGMRYDYNSLYGNVFSPRLNYKISSKNNLNILRISIGNGYRVANVFTEDHAALTGARKVVFANQLKPETSWNSNINFVKKIYTKKNHSFGIDASVFYTYFNNRIIPDYLTDVNKIIYDNLNGFSVSKGVSLNLDIELENGLKIIAGGTFMDVTFTNNGIKQRQLLTEKFSGVWSVNYYFSKIGLSIDYTGNIYGSMLLPLLGALDNRAGESPVWSLQNIQLTKKLKKGFQIYGGVKNLLNYTPPANSIARPFDPFDKEVQFDANGQAISTPNNPNALTFDANYVFAPNQGIRFFVGLRWSFR
ncbi:MAG: TonB-dependent receptor [Bacteroidetes bacterium]|nr:MAG: TonB-dependent receptor [Bacteroidota bacterium]TAG91270.1 MAG: TonB-dependent receptor [Bacteroidota bacterium]